MNKIDKSSPIPLYFQVKEIIKNKIKNNEWITDSTIPSELKLCEDFQISRGTVRQAIFDLIKEGYLVRKHGLGTYACKPNYFNPVSSFYSKKFIGKNNEKIKLKRKIFSDKIVIPNKEIKEVMDLHANEELYRIEGMLLINNTPISLEVLYLLKHLFPNLKSKDLSSMAPYEVFMRKYNLEISEVHESFSLKKLDLKSSNKLGLQDKTFALLVNRLAWSHNIIFEYRQSIIRTDKCHYTVKLLRT